MDTLSIGTSVLWVRACSDPKNKNAIGTILSVHPSDSGDDMFAEYDVQFDFGIRTLYGTQVEVANKPSKRYRTVSNARPSLS
jgi:hypothetical protein